MHQNKIWLTFLLVLIGAILGYTANVFWHYFSSGSVSLKEILYAITLWCIGAYFIGLGYYVGKRKK